MEAHPTSKVILGSIRKAIAGDPPVAISIRMQMGILELTAPLGRCRLSERLGRFALTAFPAIASSHIPNEKTSTSPNAVNDPLPSGNVILGNV